MKIKTFTSSLLLFATLLVSCNTSKTENVQNTNTNQLLHVQTGQQPQDSLLYESETLTIRQISEHVYEHTSYLSTEDFGNVPCNGMIVFNGTDAIVFDTPADATSSEELLKKLDEMGLRTKAVVATHFHADCIAGLNQFQAQNIPSYANTRTIVKLDELNSETMPQNGFDNDLELELGSQKVYAKYFGEGHTKDNIVGYFPAEKVLFGGCLIKEMDAEKGNLEDANTDAWSATVSKLKRKYPDIQLVVPGHGATGGPELLDYTIALFE